MEEKKVLCVGLLCLDIVTVCRSYPQEDTDQRCLDIKWQVGGNSANNSVVLAHLGENPDLLGNFADDVTLPFLEKTLREAGVDISGCPVLPEQNIPISTVTVNTSNGSRTIRHHRGSFPELSVRAFTNVDLSKYSWIIFEGRNVDNVLEMISYVRRVEPSVRIAVEVEKPNEQLGRLLPLGDVVFISKDYAQFKGFNSKEETVKCLQEKVSVGSILVCPWGEDGAAALVDGNVVSVPAVPPARVVDTLGAGDTFVSSTVLALSKGHSVKKSITFGCEVAGFKCGVSGLNGLRDAKEKLLSVLVH